MKFFMYGTLKVNGWFGKNFDEFRINSENAILPGFDLFSINGAYPAAIPGKGKVHGELHEFNENHLPAIIKKLDAIEGYSKHHTKGNLYNRCPYVVYTDKGAEIAQVYVYNHKTKGQSKIKSGIWINK